MQRGVFPIISKIAIMKYPFLIMQYFLLHAVCYHSAWPWPCLIPYRSWWHPSRPYPMYCWIIRWSRVHPSQADLLCSLSAILLLLLVLAPTFNLGWPIIPRLLLMMVVVVAVLMVVTFVRFWRALTLLPRRVLDPKMAAELADDAAVTPGENLVGAE